MGCSEIAAEKITTLNTYIREEKYLKSTISGSTLRKQRDKIN